MRDDVFMRDDVYEVDRESGVWIELDLDDVPPLARIEREASDRTPRVEN